jgi:hypothetical protein
VWCHHERVRNAFWVLRIAVAVVVGSALVLTLLAALVFVVDLVANGAPLGAADMLVIGALVNAFLATVVALLTVRSDELAVPLWWIARIATTALVLAISLAGLWSIHHAGWNVGPAGIGLAIVLIAGSAAAVALAWLAAIFGVYRPSARWFRAHPVALRSARPSVGAAR